MLSIVALLQGLYFLVTGLWPLFSIDTFMKITGPKVDIWLVKTVGVVVAAIGAGLLVGYFTDEITVPLVLVAIGSGLGLAGIDIYYVRKGTIAPIYLMDALAEFIFIGWWLFWF